MVVYVGPSGNVKYCKLKDVREAYLCHIRDSKKRYGKSLRLARAMTMTGRP